MKDAFAKRVVNHASEGDAIAESHGRSVLHVLRARRAFAGQNKLHVISSRADQPGHLKKIADAFFGDDPADLANDGSVPGNSKSFAEAGAGTVVRGHARESDAVVNHLVPIARQ